LVSCAHFHFPPSDWPPLNWGSFFIWPHPLILRFEVWKLPMVLCPSFHSLCVQFGARYQFVRGAGGFSEVCIGFHRHPANHVLPADGECGFVFRYLVQFLVVVGSTVFHCSPPWACIFLTAETQGEKRHAVIFRRASRVRSLLRIEGTNRLSRALQANQYGSATCVQISNSASSYSPEPPLRLRLDVCTLCLKNRSASFLWWRKAMTLLMIDTTDITDSASATRATTIAVFSSIS